MGKTKPEKVQGGNKIEICLAEKKKRKKKGEKISSSLRFNIHCINERNFHRNQRSGCSLVNPLNKSGHVTTYQSAASTGEEKNRILDQSIRTAGFPRRARTHGEIE